MIISYNKSFKSLKNNKPNVSKLPIDTEIVQIQIYFYNILI